MEFSPFDNHPNRYVLHPHRPPLPPPPPPPNLADRRRNFYPPHHLMLTPLLSCPPPPPPPQYHPPLPSLRPPPPPPSPYNPQHPHFTFINEHPYTSPIDDDLRRFHRRQSPPHIAPFELDHPLQDHRLSRPLPLNFDPEPPVPLEPFINHSSLSPYHPSDNNYIHDLDYQSRVRDEYNYHGFKDEIRLQEFGKDYWRGDDKDDLDANYSHGIENYDHSLDRNSRDFDFGLDHPNASNSDFTSDFMPIRRNYDPFYRPFVDNESFHDDTEVEERCLRSRQPPMIIENHERSNSQEISVVSGRRGPRIMSGSGRLVCRKKEDREELVHSPEKQVQKKSALLRIQLGKSSNRNRSQDLYSSKGYFDRNYTGTFRGRDKNIVVPPKRVVKEGSPVELDVSFKSNALVAKAIVAPSGSTVDSERNLTPRKRKIRKTSVSDSPLAKFNDASVKLHGSMHGRTSGNGKDLTRSTEEVVVSGSGSECGIALNPCSIGEIDSGRITEAKGSSKLTLSDQGGRSVGSSGALSHNIRKKKKATSSVSHVSRHQPANTCSAEPNADCSKSQSGFSLIDDGAKHLEGNSNSEVMNMMHDIVLRPPSDELKGNEIDKSPVGLCKNITEIDSRGPSMPSPKRKRSNSTDLLDLTSYPNTEIAEGSDRAERSLHDFLSVPNSAKGLTEFQDGIALSSIDKVTDISRQLCLNGVSVKGSTDDFLILDVNGNIGMPRAGEIICHTKSKVTHASVHDVCSTPASEYEVIKGQENMILSDMVSIDAGPKQNLDVVHEAMVKKGKDYVNGSFNAVLSDASDSIFYMSNPEEIKTQDASTYVDRSNRYSSTTSSSNSGLSHSEECTLVSNAGFVDDVRTRSCLGGATISLKNGHRQKLWNSDSSLSNVLVSDEALNHICPLPAIATTLGCPCKDSVSYEDERSGSGIFVCSLPCVDGDKIVDSKILSEQSSEVNNSPNAISPNCRKKRKVFASGESFPTLSDIHDGPSCAKTSTTSIEMPSNIEETVVQSKDKMVPSITDTVSSIGLPPCSESPIVTSENTKFRRSPDAVLIEDKFTRYESACSSSWEAEQKENAAIVATTANHQNRDVEYGGVEHMHVVKEHGMLYFAAGEYRTSAATGTIDLNQGPPSRDECDGILLEKDNMPSTSSNTSPSSNNNGNSATNSSNELMDSMPDRLLNIGSSEKLSTFSGLQMLNTESAAIHVSNEENCRDDKNLDSEHVSESGSLRFSINISANGKSNMELGHAGARDSLIITKATSFLSQNMGRTTHSLNSMKVVSSTTNNQLTSPVPEGFTDRSSLNFTASRKALPTSHIRKPRTWHRTASPSVFPVLVSGSKSYSSLTSQGQVARKVGKIQSSYIRKGNSLVRKASPVTSLHIGSQALSSSVSSLKPSGVDETRNSKQSEISVDYSETPSCLGTETLVASLERPKIPPPSQTGELVGFSSISDANLTSSALEDSSIKGCVKNSMDPFKLVRNIDVPKFADDAIKISEIPQTGLSNKLESQSSLDECNLVKKITYVKRKSNQLVAASNTSDLPAQGKDQDQGSSKGYYKRRNNQLIRTSLESEVMQRMTGSNGNLNLEGQRASKVIPSKNSSKRVPSKGGIKIYKPKTLSFVWTLSGTQSSKRDGNSLRCREMWTHLFPWKRATFWRSLMRNSASMSDKSTISQNLLLSRKRDAIYTRSTHGFSLQISKVLSVGGSSLKWSKSIERNSKKANEEATLAVAAAEKKKREQNDECAFARTKSRSISSRGRRIYRIRSFRYKMDPTRRTLQRISDEEQFCSGDIQSEGIRKNSYIPKRLVIGNDEYVRIGNGNQLIRDPKKRTRMLASEKVRWSLHTARLRLARKRKYCQFFTRFGKCNKDDGKCPYIHDPSKIAVCTKFLNGSCSNSNCKLTHKVIPERMQDCSYFLQGLCSNENCPYRHVNVNPNASICEGFLRGYCADGNECRKKHTYVCQLYEATGICPQGLKCKLHHPNKRKRGTKRKTGREKKNSGGRYFGTRDTGSIKWRTAVSEKNSSNDDVNIFFQDGKFSDYISLDASDEEAVEFNDMMMQQSMSDTEPTDIQVEDTDELTKPIRIFNKIMTEVSPVFSFSVKVTASKTS